MCGGGGGYTSSRLDVLVFPCASQVFTKVTFAVKVLWLMLKVSGSFDAWTIDLCFPDLGKRSTSSLASICRSTSAFS